MSAAEDRLAKLISLFEARGHARIDPPILQPADVFLDLTGEDIRRRLYLSADQDGRDLCLRPDFTIPVCRAHIAENKAGAVSRYCYGGPVFRQRPGGTGEFLQAGVEDIGRTDRANADAEVLALALDGLADLGAGDLSVRIGDEALFSAVIDGLGLPTVWKRRLRDLFGERDQLDQAIARMEGQARDGDNEDGARAGVLAALEGSDPEAAQAIVEDLLSIAGIATVGGRTAGEIAERFLEQAALSSRKGIADEAASTLKRFLDTSGAPEAAIESLKAFSADTGIDLAAPLSNFEARLKALEGTKAASVPLSFSADFGRRLDYYTGFVFEVHDAKSRDKGQIVGGGRYDKLLELLGASISIPAVGFSIWLDRI
ncbi:ATP phosphoribosyltransferase regulatory subunit [Rhizobiales bacterium]|uniref:ATP phosphoribosyltransferase regulatory subunit n=1 Tax=Hongsoonwoonella zoysiae TaxID=2821844 RepID=UPI0015603E12|nr:ATP phosphoribosyltransferase regulatory subunit [Hongsoonwoonella zoysiae]NRG19865.1 ATP phosphoribosyltransferase regulatory subunit [Hongsoonwoonella zoysiae]